MKDKLPEAEIERVVQTRAKCPNCEDDHDVDDFGEGVIECHCRFEFYWCSGS